MATHIRGQRHGNVADDRLGDTMVLVRDKDGQLLELEAKDAPTDLLPICRS